MQGHFDGFHGAAFSGGIACSHDEDLAVVHDGIDVGKVDVDVAVEGDDLGHSLDGGGDDAVGQFEGLPGRQIPINGMKLLVTDNQHAVGELTQPHDALNGLVVSFFALGGRGNGDHGNGEDSQFAGQAGDDRSTPVPVPPPMPAVIKSILVFSSSTFLISS